MGKALDLLDDRPDLVVDALQRLGDQRLLLLGKPEAEQFQQVQALVDVPPDAVEHLVGQRRLPEPVFVE